MPQSPWRLPVLCHRALQCLYPLQPACGETGCTQPRSSRAHGRAELLYLAWLGGDLGPSLQHPSMAEPSSPSTQPGQSPHAGMPEAAPPARLAAWQHLEQTWPLALPIHDWRQAEVACPQALRSLLLLQPILGRGSLLASQKAAWLRGSGGLVLGHSMTMGEVQEEKNQSHDQDESRTQPFCWPWTSFTCPSPSGTSGHCGR